MAFLAGPSWREFVDSDDHWLEHLKEGFAAFVDTCEEIEAYNALMDKMVQVEQREDGTTELVSHNFPREVWNMTFTSWAIA